MNTKRGGREARLSVLRLICWHINALVRALPYIGIGIPMLISLPLLRNLLPKNSLSICNISEDFGQRAVEDFQAFFISWWVFPFLRFQFCLYRLFRLWLFCSGLGLNACFSAIGRVLVMELYAGFWDVLRLGGVPIGFLKAPRSKVLVMLSFC